MSLLSVIIPTYNASLLIRRAVESVLGQKGGLSLEVLVVDDGSTDDTVSVVESIGDPRVRVFRQERNLGPAAARNRGLREAEGEYVAFLDGDDYWEPEFLQTTASFLAGHPECVAVSVMQCHKIIGKDPAIAPQETGVNAPVVLEDFFEFWGRHNHVCTGSVLFRRETALAIGGQREELRVCEDLEFWAMLATYGKWGFIPQVLFTSDGGAVTRKYGAKNKNLVRMRSVTNINEWGKRLFPRLDETQYSSLIPLLNRITIPGTYSLLYIGRIHQAYDNIKFYIKTTKNVPIIVTCSHYGYFIWYLFAMAYRGYRYLKDHVNGVN